MNIDKLCKKCNITKDIKAFTPRKDSPDGYRHICVACNKTKNQKYYMANKDKISTKQQEYRAKNKNKLQEMNRKWKKQKRDSDPLYRLSHNLRSLMAQSFKRQKYHKDTLSFEIFGADIETIKKHLVETAKQNYGVKYTELEKYEIDHIIPLSSAKTKDELISLNHYTNLQYLTKKDNNRKSDKINWTIP